MLNDTSIYAGSGPGTHANGRRDMNTLFTYPAERWFNKARWSLKVAWAPGVRAVANDTDAVIAHKCAWPRNTPWFEGYKYAYNILPELECPEHCWRCYAPMPEEVVGLWRMQNA